MVGVYLFIDSSMYAQLYVYNALHICIYVTYAYYRRVQVCVLVCEFLCMYV